MIRTKVKFNGGDVVTLCNSCDVMLDFDTTQQKQGTRFCARCSEKMQKLIVGIAHNELSIEECKKLALALEW